MKKLLISFFILIQLLCQFSLRSEAQVHADEQDTVHFFLLRGLTRESGHWGRGFEDSVKLVFTHAEVTYLDLPGSGIHHKLKAPMSVYEIMIFMRRYYFNKPMAPDVPRVLVATSLGGMVATEWAQTYPEDFHSMVLVSVSLGGVCKLNPDLSLENLCWDKRPREVL